MRFAPKPENDFAFFIRTYYDECRQRFDKIEAIAGKWMFRDLMPGMSDFDTRFIVSNDMTVEDWCRMSTAVGDVHLTLCRKYPAWARLLEHLPGVNVTWDELVSDQTYYPECQQWSFYHTENQDNLSAAIDHLAHREWDIKDEYFHLKKFCLYYGRYDRSIDPAINLGVHANKYPLHSRIMHYFTPPIHSAMFLLYRRSFVGKFEALDIAAKRFPELKCWDMIWEILAADYKTPKWYKEPHLTELEDALEEALRVVAIALRDVVTLIPHELGSDVAAWRGAVEGVQIDRALRIVDSAKFSRLMKGRLRFYANAPQFFDNVWLIRNELGRIGNNLLIVPVSIYWSILTGQQMDDVDVVLEQLRGGLLTDEDIDVAKEFHRMTSGPLKDGTECQAALDVANIFDDFFAVLCKISNSVMKTQTSSIQRELPYHIRKGTNKRCKSTA